MHGGNNGDRLEGDAGNDTLHGGAGFDTLFGGEGDDQLFGGISEDEVNGGNGSDTVEGGAGDDVVVGGNGNDLLRGGAGDDITYGGTGNDTLDGGSGNDILDGGTGADSLYGGSGNDLYAVRAGFGQKTIKETSSDGNDRIIFDHRLAEVDFRASYTHESLGYVLVVQSGNDLNAHIVNPNNIERFEFADGSVLSRAPFTWSNWSEGKFAGYGGSGDDKIHADGSLYWISGGAGDDDLKGATYLVGGDGDDTYRVAQGDTTRLIYGDRSGTDRIVFEDIDLADVTFSFATSSWIPERLQLSWTNDDGSSQRVQIGNNGEDIERFECERPLNPT